MEENQYRKNAYDMIELVRCAVSGEICDKNRIAEMHLDEIFKISQEHILSACVAYGLEASGIKQHDFIQAKEKAIRKNILLDAERGNILRRLEQEKIWYMPLKGSILKDWYPKLGMRQMSDNDILCEGTARPRIKEIMLEMGFTCKHFGKESDDAYYKPPVFNFEMHGELFWLTHTGLYEYYADVKNRLLKDEGNDYGYHFRTEDFYLYLTAHEYKHYIAGGTGIRSLLDTYIFMKKFGDSLDWDYMNAELEKLGIADYEKQSRQLALSLFSGKTLTKEEARMLDYYIFSGIYGTLENRVENKIEKGSKANYIFRRLFPTMKEIQVHWPFFYRHKYLIPVLLIARPIRGLIVHREKVRNEIKYLMQSKK